MLQRITTNSWLHELFPYIYRQGIIRTIVNLDRGQL